MVPGGGFQLNASNLRLRRAVRVPQQRELDDLRIWGGVFGRAVGRGHGTQWVGTMGSGGCRKRSSNAETAVATAQTLPAGVRARVASPRAALYHHV